MIAIILEMSLVMGTILDLALVGLAVAALIAVVKLPGLVREVLARQAASNAALGEIRAAMRKLTDG